MKNKWVVRYETSPLKHRYTFSKHKFYLTAWLCKKFYQFTNWCLESIDGDFVNFRFWIEKTSYKKNKLKYRPQPVLDLNTITFK